MGIDKPTHDIPLKKKKLSFGSCFEITYENENKSMKILNSFFLL